MSLSVASFYAFVALPDFAALQAPLRGHCARLGVTGTILLAPEGINGTVAGGPSALDGLLRAMKEGPLFGDRLSELEVKFSTAQAQPFKRLKVRLKREIVTLGDAEADPTMRTGAYVAAADWNALIARPDVVVVDVRNGFEVDMGSFEGALDPKTRRFSDFKTFAMGQLADAKGGTVALFCTGGIRCEKASAYLLANGFVDVRQLRGGILKYLEEIDLADSRWRGDCFVFDDRVALGHRLVERRSEGADV